MKGDALPNQLITFTRCFPESLPIKYRDFPPAAHKQTGMFQLARSIRNGRPLHCQHCGEQVLGDRHCVIVTAVTHHEQPTCQALLDAVRTVARYRHQNLL